MYLLDRCTGGENGSQIPCEPAKVVSLVRVLVVLSLSGVFIELLADACVLAL